MNIPLSPRLKACCAFLVPGERVADVGTDHGYLGIWLLTQVIAPSVIASDIGQGPLAAARANAERFGCTDKMEFYLSDGVENIPRDFDTLVIAGMGAHTMVHILGNAPWLQNRRYRLVLQCQNKAHLLRAFLSQNGWHIPKERIVRDGRFLYSVLEAVYQPGHSLTPGQCWLSPALLACGSPDLNEYTDRTLRSLRKAVLGDPSLLPALQELEKERRIP